MNLLYTFSFAKPTGLIRFLIKLLDKKDMIILDFFSWPQLTTAHAVMQLNAEDEGNRRFIMVQLPEATPERESFNKKWDIPNICEIGKERIRRAGDKN